MLEDKVDGKDDKNERQITTAEQTIKNDRVTTTIEATSTVQPDTVIEMYDKPGPAKGRYVYPSVKHEVSQTTQETRADGTLKTESYEKHTEEYPRDNLSVEVSTNTVDKSYHSNGNLKSSRVKETLDVQYPPNAWNIVQGHTDTQEFGNSKETVSTYDRSGHKKDELFSQEYYGDDWHYRQHSYTKGEEENPDRGMTTVVSDGHGQKQDLRVSDWHRQQNKDQEYAKFNGHITNNGESYSFERNGKRYDVQLDAEGQLQATKTVMKKDAENAQKKLGRITSEYLLAKSRRKADRVVRKLTSGEQKNTQQYRNSVHAVKKENPQMLGDMFDYPAEKEQELKELRKDMLQKQEERFENKSQVTAQMLLNKKLKDLPQNR